MTVLVLLAWLLAAPSNSVLPGAQAERAEIGLSLASRQGWVPFVALEGSLRAGFPEPMVSRRSEVCVGFSRLDFGPDDRRPTLARCLSADVPGALGRNEIMTVNVVAAGHDTWHFVEAGGPIEAVEVGFVNSRSLSGDRIVVAESMFALRLPNDVDLQSVEWATADGRFRCEPDPEGWRTSVLCSGP